MSEPDPMSDRDRGGEPPRSGLRNPQAAVRAVGAAAYAIEGLVLLLAIQPLRVLGVALTGVAIGVVVALALGCFILAGLVRHRWAWYATAAVQAPLLVSGLIFHASLAVMAVIFGLLWIYLFHVRRSVLGSG